MTGECAKRFLENTARHLANRVQVTPDGHNACLKDVEGAFGCDDVEYAHLVKIYGAAPESAKGHYSPTERTVAKKVEV